MGSPLQGCANSRKVEGWASGPTSKLALGRTSNVLWVERDAPKGADTRESAER